ncbi:MAG: hemerythrin domain-containing protein [Bacteroidia bacterium]|nr:hemerythrin domain-containing protein [Bacteroidia bacterium]
MSNPIDVMHHEHDIILNAGHAISNLKDLWLTDAESYTNKIKLLVNFFKEYSDGYHHRKEEEVLFPAIKSHPDFVLQEIIEEFEQHHEDFREYTAEINEALSEGNYDKSYKVLKQYFNDLMDHIAAENEELFVLAESLMSEEQLATIYFKFKDIDMEIGEQRKADFENMIQSL